VTLDDDVERLRAKKKSYEESECEAGLEFGEECGTELAKYSALLRIPIAMEEVRREIEAQGLQDLIDRTQNGCGRLGQILGRSRL
jgi:hypothetical protein